MASSNLRIDLGIRVAFIALGVFLFSYLLFAGRYPFSTAMAGAAILAQCWLLVASLERRNRVLTSFFEAVKNADFTQNYSFPRGASYKALKAEYEQVMGILKAYSLDREKQYRYVRTIARCIGVGLVVYDQDGRVDLCNEAFMGMTGMLALRRVEELGRVNAELLASFREMKDGERRTLDTSLDDERCRLLIAATDFIQARKKYRVVSVQNIRRELEENEMDAWQKLARVLTHEIMNSITPISSLASTSLSILGRVFEDGGAGHRAEADGGSDAIAAIRAIERRSLGLLRFVENYREFLRIPKPVLAPVPCMDLFARVQALMGGMLEKKKIRLACSVAPRDLELTADADLVEQALINLAKNSIEALVRTKKPVVEIAAYLDDRRRPVIEISDNGAGIVQENLDKIFIPFFSTKGEGSGIGLSLCRQIMVLHNGTISAQSLPGEKTVFALRF